MPCMYETQTNQQREQQLWWLQCNEQELLQEQHCKYHSLLELNQHRAANSRIPLEFVGGLEHFHPPYTEHSSSAESYDRITICMQSSTAPLAGSPVASRHLWALTSWDADGIPTQCQLLDSPSIDASQENHMLQPLGLRSVLCPCWAGGGLPMAPTFRVLKPSETLTVSWQQEKGVPSRRDLQDRQVFALVENAVRHKAVPQKHKKTQRLQPDPEVCSAAVLCEDLDFCVQLPDPIPEPIDVLPATATLLPSECGGQVDLSDPDSWVFPEDDDEDDDDNWCSDSDSDSDCDDSDSDSNGEGVCPDGDGQ